MSDPEVWKGSDFLMQNKLFEHSYFLFLAAVPKIIKIISLLLVVLLTKKKKSVFKVGLCRQNKLSLCMPENIFIIPEVKWKFG